MSTTERINRRNDCSRHIVSLGCSCFLLLISWSSSFPRAVLSFTTSGLPCHNFVGGQRSYHCIRDGQYECPAKERLWSPLVAKMQDDDTPSASVQEDNNNNNGAPSKSRRILILNYDGTITNNARQKAELCLGVALQTWPRLGEQLGVDITKNQGLEDSLKGADVEWLLNKMMACSHAMANDGKSTLSSHADLCMLARLIVEEQRLDEGRNTGRNGGKYGGKFMPKTAVISSDIDEEGESRSNEGKRGAPAGSRPLTVGEIGANWLDGGHLRDTVRVKYNVDGKDPVPILREAIVVKLEEKTSLHRDVKKTPEMMDILESDDRKVIVVLGHQAYTNEAVRVIAHPYPYDYGSQMCHDKDDEDGEVLLLKDPHKNPRTITITAPEEDDCRPRDSELKVIKSIISSFGTGEDGGKIQVCVLHSSIRVLQELKYLFGDDSPMLRDGFGPMGTCTDQSIELGLFLPSWSDCVSVQQQNDAIMDPWLQVISTDDLANMLRKDSAISAWE